MKPGDRRATRWVFLNLDKDVGDLRDAWESCLGPKTTLEEFKANASRYLRDKSELSSKTIDCADWEEIYAWYKSFLEEK